MNPLAVSTADRLEEIRKAYIQEIPIQLEAIRKMYQTLTENPSDQYHSVEFHRLIHTLKGASASFALHGLCGAADAAERLAKDWMQRDPTLDTVWHESMGKCLSRLEAEAGKINPSLLDRLHTEFLTAAPKITNAKDQKIVYLWDDDPHQCQYLSTQLECFGFRVVPFAEPESLFSAACNCTPDVVVIDQVVTDRSGGKADALTCLRKKIGIDTPAVIISSHNDLPYRLAAVRAGADAYFVKPVNVTELCSTLNALTGADKPEPYRVLIVDDAPHLSRIYATTLQDAGMITLTVSDPLQVMVPLFDFKPDLILMDMYMPGCNGMELAKAIRQMGASFSIPIVYLSGETDTDKQFHAIRMGGDEFLTKPISPEHLISAVAGRAERMKVIRSLMIRDGMTGLYNHTTTKEYLEMFIAQARRQGTEVCFVMIDLDHFKQINDTYGHPVGDQVLVALSRLLRQGIRSSDVVGRMGGEEFALILPDCKLNRAVSLLNRIRKNFAEIRFPVAQTAFSVTFSAGIAALSNHQTGYALCKGADDALYKAKRAGRNRVTTADRSTA